MSFVRSEPNRRPSFQPSEPMVRASQSRPARSPSLARVVRNNGDEAAPQSRPPDWSWTPAFAGVTRGDIRGRGLREQRIRTKQLEAGIALPLTALQRASGYLLVHAIRANAPVSPSTNYETRTKHYPLQVMRYGLRDYLLQAFTGGHTGPPLRRTQAAIDAFTVPTGAGRAGKREHSEHWAGR